MNQNPYGDPPPNQPYGAPPPGAYPPQGGYPGQPPHGYPPHGYPPQPGGNSRTIWIIVGAVVLVPIIGALIFLLAERGRGGSASSSTSSSGSTSENSTSPSRGVSNYDRSPQGQEPALTEAYLSNGSWKERCDIAAGVQFRSDHVIRVTDNSGGPPREGTWQIVNRVGANMTVNGRTSAMTLIPLGENVMSLGFGGSTQTLRRCVG